MYSNHSKPHSNYHGNSSYRNVPFDMINKLILIAVILLCCTCNFQGKEQNDANSKMPTHKQESSHTLTFFITDGLNYAQVIQCTDSTLKHGYAEVYLNDKLSESIFVWDESMDYKSGGYPIVERMLDDREREIVRSIIENLRHTTYKDPNEVKDDYQYMIYLDNQRVVSAFTLSLEIGDLPKGISKDILDILSIPAELYPNFWIAN